MGTEDCQGCECRFDRVAGNSLFESTNTPLRNREMSEVMARRGNPNWGKAMLDAMPAVPSRFEKLVEKLGLENNPEQWPHSEPLREWARANRHFYFVPERLLASWGLIVKDDW